MTKPLRIVDAVAEHDIPAIVDYHRPRSKGKAERFVAEYDRIIEHWPLILTSLPSDRMVGASIHFRQARICFYYREFETHWLVAGVFHALRDPDWILSQALIREAAE